jgi:hypothetical protein
MGGFYIYLCRRGNPLRNKTCLCYLRAYRTRSIGYTSFIPSRVRLLTSPNLALLYGPNNVPMLTPTLILLFSRAPSMALFTLFAIWHI